MNKKDLATVLVRFAGLYFAYLSLTKIISLLSFFYMITGIMNSSNAGEIDVTEKLNILTSVPGIISFLVTSCLALYLLRNGSWVIRFLSKDSPNMPD